LKEYNIYENPFGFQEAVKIGWSWPAFIFGGFWALWKKLWFIGSITICVYLIMFITLEFLSWFYFFKYLSVSFFKPFEGLIENYTNFAFFRSIFFLIGLIISIFFGKHGNKWREKNLISRGFEFKGTIRAETPEGAIAKHFKNSNHKDDRRYKESSFNENRTHFKKDRNEKTNDDDRRWAPPGYFDNEEFTGKPNDSFKFESKPKPEKESNDDLKWTPPSGYSKPKKRDRNMINSYFKDFKAQFNGKFGELAFSMTSRMFLSSKYQIFNDVVLKIPNGTTQIDQIIISNFGIFVIEIKTFKGWIYGGEKQKQWYQVFNKNKKYRFKNPIHQNWLHIKALKDSMKFKLHEDAFKTVILFSGEVNLKSDFPPYVVKGLNYIDYIKSFKEEILTNMEVSYVIEKMKEFQASRKDHKEHIEKIRDQRNFETDSIPNCPACGKPMKIRVSSKGPSKGKRFWGCSDYPKCKKTFECMN
jgi:hypothetical protein